MLSPALLTEYDISANVNSTQSEILNLAQAAQTEEGHPYVQP